MLSKPSVVRSVPLIWVFDHDLGTWMMYMVVDHIQYTGRIIGSFQHVFVHTTCCFHLSIEPEDN